MVMPTLPGYGYTPQESEPQPAVSRGQNRPHSVTAVHLDL